MDGYGHMYKEAFPKVFFTPLIDAFKSICRDDMFSPSEVQSELDNLL